MLLDWVGLAYPVDPTTPHRLAVGTEVPSPGVIRPRCGAAGHQKPAGLPGWPETPP